MCGTFTFSRLQTLSKIAQMRFIFYFKTQNGSLQLRWNMLSDPEMFHVIFNSVLGGAVKRYHAVRRDEKRYRFDDGSKHERYNIIII